MDPKDAVPWAEITTVSSKSDETPLINDINDRGCSDIISVIYITPARLTQSFVVLLFGMTF